MKYIDPPSDEEAVATHAPATDAPVESARLDGVREAWKCPRHSAAMTGPERS